MFKKLVSNLPFNPGLIQQVAFYGKRLHKEQGIRRISFVFMAATLLINIVAIASPAQNTLAGSDSNIMVGGGATTKEGIIQKYDQDPWVRAVFSSFGISKEDIQKMTPETLSVSAANNAGEGLVTAGRRPNGSAGEYPVNIAGANIYRHSLDSAFRTDSVQVISCQKEICGRYKAIILVCGNPLIDIYEKPPTPVPDPTPLGYVDGSDCSSIFGWAYNNQFARYVHLYVDKPAFGGAVAGTDYHEVAATQDTRPDVATVYPGTPSSVGWSWDGGPLKDDGKDHKIWAYVTDRSSHYALLTNGEGRAVNFTCPKPVVVTCPAGPLAGQPAKDNDVRNCPESPVASCTKLTILSNAVQKDTEARFVITATALNGATISGYYVDFGDGSDKTFSSTAGSLDVTHKYKDVGTYKVVATAKTSLGDKTSADCSGTVDVKPQPVPCPHDATILFSDTKNCNPCPENPTLPASNKELCIAPKILSKKVANVTKGVTDANGSTASAGDILEYTLITQNTAKKLDVKHTTTESIRDLLDYAELSDAGTAKLDADKNLVWPEATIVAGAQLKQVFKVKVKDVIASTPTSISDAGTFDLKMVNVYGNSTTVNLASPTKLTIQRTAEQLPHTGPGSSLVLTFFAVIVLGFFYSRSRVLAKEVDIVRYEYSRGV